MHSSISTFLRTKRFLLLLLIINVIASVLHYVDNIRFFQIYPEPPWINPQMIDSFWFVMTPFGILGYLFYCRGLYTYSSICLYVYSLMSLLVLGHYRYGSMGEMSPGINLFILVEAIAAVALIAYTLWRQFALNASVEIER